MTTVNSCRMIEAEMYGMIPSAKIENCSRAPPENRLNIPNRPPDLMSSCIASRLTPGVVMKTPVR